MPIESLLGFVVLYVLAKWMERGLPFYVAGVLCAIFLTAINLVFDRVTTPALDYLALTATVKAIAAITTFYFLAKYEDSVAGWCVTFAFGFIVLIILL